MLGADLKASVNPTFPHKGLKSGPFFIRSQFSVRGQQVLLAPIPRGLVTYEQQYSSELLHFVLTPRSPHFEKFADTASLSCDGLAGVLQRNQPTLYAGLYESNEV